MVRTWFCSSKGNDSDIKITFLSLDGKQRNFNQRHQFRGMEGFIRDNIDTIVSFPYTIMRLKTICPNVDVKMLDLMLMFKDILILFKDENLNRSTMLTKLGFNIREFEPSYPNSYGDQTCRAYIAIYNNLQELIEF